MKKNVAVKKVKKDMVEEAGPVMNKVIASKMEQAKIYIDRINRLIVKHSVLSDVGEFKLVINTLQPEEPAKYRRNYYMLTRGGIYNTVILTRRLENVLTVLYQTCKMFKIIGDESGRQIRRFLGQMRSVGDPLRGELHELNILAAKRQVFDSNHVHVHSILAITGILNNHQDPGHILTMWKALYSGIQAGVIHPHAIDVLIFNRSSRITEDDIRENNGLWVELKEILMRRYTTLIQIALLYKKNGQI